MNQMEKDPQLPGLAKLVYGDGEYNVVTVGSFVLCAVTGQKIELEDLRYWSVERQEAYASAEAATERFEVFANKNEEPA